MSVRRWLMCRVCGMVKDTPGQAHSDYEKYEEQGPYFITEADHVAALAAGQAPAAPLCVGRWVAGADGVDRWHHTGSGSGEAPAAPGKQIAKANGQ